MSQSKKGEFMDFYTDAVTLLEALTRTFYIPDFFAGLIFGKRQRILPEKKRETALPPVRITRLWPPIRAEPGKRQAETINETTK